MKKIFTLFFAICSFIDLSIAQAPSIQWQKCFGGSDEEKSYSICSSSDGGFAVAGNAESLDGDVSGFHGGIADIWVVKLDNSGNIKWQKCYGGSQGEYAESIESTVDNGYIILGGTKSTDGDISDFHGGTGDDMWIIKIDSIGNILWKKCLGGTSMEAGYCVQQTNDNGYILSGYTNSSDGDVTGNHGGGDIWIVKLNYSGNIVWQKCFGGTGNDNAREIIQTYDNGYIFSGYTNSNDGDVSGNHGSGDIWVVKLDASGNIVWQKCFGGTGGEYPQSIIQINNSDYIIAGSSSSNDGDVTGNHGGGDMWVIKLSSSGTLDWQKCLGGTYSDAAKSIKYTIDNGFIVAGSTASNDGDVSGNHVSTGDYAETWIAKLDNLGNLQWQKCIGGTEDDWAESILQTSDGGFILTGPTQSDDGDVSGNHVGGSYDFWVVKLSSLGNVNEINSSISLNIFPIPATKNFSVTFPSETKVIQIINSLGQIEQRVFVNNQNSAYFSVDKNGIYFVQILLDKQLITKKIIIAN